MDAESALRAVLETEITNFDIHERVVLSGKLAPVQAVFEEHVRKPQAKEDALKGLKQFGDFLEAAHSGDRVIAITSVKEMARYLARLIAVKRREGRSGTEE